MCAMRVCACMQVCMMTVCMHVCLSTYVDGCACGEGWWGGGGGGSMRVRFHKEQTQVMGSSSIGPDVTFVQQRSPATYEHFAGHTRTPGAP